MATTATSFTARAGAEIPQFLFTSSDASLQIFDFLADDKYQSFGGDGTFNRRVLNWTEYCASPGDVVLGYGPFLGCLLYPNVTRNIRDGHLPPGLTDIGYGSLDNQTGNLLPRRLRSRIPTCLVAYCASQPECTSTRDCDIGNLLTDDLSSLSAAGVGRCWQTLCSLNVQALDADIAGVGILISYLIQTSIALLAFCALTALAGATRLYERRVVEATSNSHTTRPATKHRHILTGIRRHKRIITDVLLDFHKAQCYYAIALQIAALAIIFGNRRSLSYNDKNFLLIVGWDGTIPVIFTLYTLMAFSHTSWYTVAMSVVTATFAFAQGGYVATRVLFPNSEAGSTSVDVSGGDWPISCGGIGPSALCAGMGPNTIGYADVATSFLVSLACMSAITGLLVLWKLIESIASIRSIMSLNVWLCKRSSLKRAIKFIFHGTVVVGALGCVCVEYYFFSMIFTSPFVNFQEWSFGQIVGITTWAAILVEFVYLECCGMIKVQVSSTPLSTGAVTSYVSVPGNDSSGGSTQAPASKNLIKVRAGTF